MDKKTIYLIGSFKDDCRDSIIRQLKDKYDFDDPRTHRQSSTAKLVCDDMRSSEINPVAFAVFTKSKGTMSYAEIGCSVTCGNHFVMADETQKPDMALNSLATSYFYKKDHAIDFLKSEPVFKINRKNLLKKYTPEMGDREISLKTVLFCGTIDDQLKKQIDKIRDERYDIKIDLKSEDASADLRNITKYDIVVAHFPADKEWDKHACLLMGAAWPHDIPVIISDCHKVKYPPLQGLARRHIDVEFLADYFLDVKDQHVNREALDMYGLFNLEQQMINS